MQAKRVRAQKDSQGIYDFDALIIEPRMVKIGGEVMDVSVIPVAVTMEIARLQDMSKAEIRAEAEKDSKATLRRAFKLVSDVCAVSNPKITPEFLMQHLDSKKFAAFSQFVLKPMTDKAEEFLEGEEGNAKTDETSSD